MLNILWWMETDIPFRKMYKMVQTIKLNRTIKLKKKIANFHNYTSVQTNQ